MVAAGAGMPLPHSHDGYEEAIYGLAGTLTFTVEGVAHPIGPGDAICVKPGEVHGFANGGEIDSKTLVTITPGVLEPAFFREIGAVLSDANGGPPDRTRIGEVMARHGLTPAPPPPA